jgi:site-specific DNA-methyltransferase (adenine-specific)
VAKKLGRRFLGFELSANYVQQVRTRLADINAGDAIAGPADPLRSAPSTAKGRRLPANKIRTAR